MGDNQQQERGIFSGIYNKIHGVQTESTQWDGSYNNANPNQGNQNQGGNQPNYNQGNYNQGNQGYNQANQVYNQANQVYNQANQGYNQGNQGYNQANQGHNQYPPQNQGQSQVNYNQGSSQPLAYNGQATTYNPSAGANPPAMAVCPPQTSGVPQHNFASNSSLCIGSIIGLKHNNSGRFLSSSSMRYQSGSGQQQVTTNQWNVSEADKWQILPGFNQSSGHGSPVSLNQMIRLKHQSTGCHLHSHPNINSPLSQYQEVSCFGGGNNSDDNDNWILEKFSYNGGSESGGVNLNDSFKLRHCKTGLYLYSHERTFQCNGATHAEVACYGNGTDENNKWRIQLA